MEMNQKQLELEMAKLEAEKDVAEAKERTEVAKLEAELAENEYSELMLNANSSSHHTRLPPGLTFGNTSHTSSLTTPPTSVQVYTFPVMNTQAHTTSTASAREYTYPAKNKQVDTLSSVFTQASTLPAVSTQAYALPVLSTQAPTLPAVFELPRVSAQVNTGPAVSTQVTTFPANLPYVGVAQAASTQVPLLSSSSLQVPRLLEASSRVSSFPVRPPMFSALANTADLTGTCVVHSHDFVAPHLLATSLSAAAQSYNHTALPSVADSSQRPLLTSQPVSGNLLAMIATTMEKMNADHGLPALQVIKFNGSPENYPMFCQRFFSNGGVEGLRRTDENGSIVAVSRRPRFISRAEVRVRSGRLNEGTYSSSGSLWSTFQDSTSMC